MLRTAWKGSSLWWLPQQQNRVDIHELQQALDYLIETGVVFRTTLPDGRMLYTGKVKNKKRAEQQS